MIYLENIKSNRVKKIANQLGISSKIYLDKYLEIRKMIVDAEEPRKDNNGNIIFPIIKLEKIYSEYGYDRYIEEILKINNFEMEKTLCLDMN